MLPLGTALPAFSLPDTDGRSVSDRDFAGADVLVVAFLCPPCPYVKHVRGEFAQVAKAYEARGVAFVGINSNDADTFPQYYGPDAMKEEMSAAGYTFPYLRDESQRVAKSFRAACTPDLFVFDRQRRLAYRGQFDDSRPSKTTPVTGADLRAALDAIIAGQTVSPIQTPSVGCNIKWKADNAPEYA